MRTILIVDDDDGMAEALVQTLAVHGYTPLRARTGAEALDLFGEASLVVLDLTLPDLAGHEVCRRIRERSCVPILAMSDRAEELDRVMAFHMGADAFAFKPVGGYELVARMQALFRRAGDCPRHTADEQAPAEPAETHASPDPPARPTGPDLLRAGPLRLDLRTRRVLLRDEEVAVTRREFDLLALLIEEPGTVRRRQDIMARVWDENWFGSTRTLDVHVGSLRTKLGSREWIETVRGIGYRLTVPAGPPTPGAAHVPASTGR
ncbi:MULTISPECIES: response regulator transcription factor [unclassified Streptomyces]|uniref:response regulator transcription factor n=1 Tax=unclassified Streptomyces TaxID=2593676 RepID=UPI001F03E31B|nr:MULTISPECIES: response regulator transcription factor [unclassified Streptomyces]MCH0562247.1 response regulator transcription factor [Streptomyces sp. MUM 2J]MCH0573101.1 response regulator transcription factor [Streptomyces sp. MUM 136J]